MGTTPKKTKSTDPNIHRSAEQKSQFPHEAVLLSKIVSDHSNIKLTFVDGEILIDQLRWHTPYHLGLNGGKVVNKSAIKYWEVI